jgi:hypothetical protein
MSSHPREQIDPAQFCGYLLTILEHAERRRKQRKRDTGPDVIGMGVKRDLLTRAVEERPAADEFEAWLLRQALSAAAGGPVHAMCREILDEYEVAVTDERFVQWLESEQVRKPRRSQQQRGSG